MMKAIFFALFVVISFCGPLNADSDTQSTKYDRAGERAKMIARLNEQRAKDIVIVNLDVADDKTKTFLNYYLDSVKQYDDKLGQIALKISLHMVMLDRALFNNQKEKEKWQKTKVELTNEYYGIANSEDYFESIKKWAELSKGLKGQFAELARKEYSTLTRDRLLPQDQWIQTELTELSTKIKDKSNSSPLTTTLSEYVEKTRKIDSDYKNGVISLEEAGDQVDKLTNISYGAYGKDVAEGARQEFKRVAILRTKMAQLKGFRTWADYVLSEAAESYAVGYRTAKQRIQFLRSFLSKTRSAYKEFLGYLAESNGKKLENITSSQINMIVPSVNHLMEEFFDKNKVEAIWKQTMLESGFPESVFENITLDNYPRKGKYTHAYMAPVMRRVPKELFIDARTLKVDGPKDEINGWHRAGIYIVQNFKGNSPDPYSTALHEGGHGIDYSYRNDVLGKGQSTGYAETHSMTLEHFLFDKEYIQAHFFNTKGEAPSDELVNTFIETGWALELFTQRTSIYQSLYDIELWNFEYTEDSIDFVERALALNEELRDAYNYEFKTRNSNNINKGYSYFVTDHYYSGEVRYIGYVYAWMAAKMSIDKIYDNLESATGRRTLNNQPSIANMLIEGYYKDGFEMEFPKSIERFTGKEYRPQDMAADYSQFIKEYVLKQRSKMNCASLLTKNK